MSWNAALELLKLEGACVVKRVRLSKKVSKCSTFQESLQMQHLHFWNWRGVVFGVWIDLGNNPPPISKVQMLHLKTFLESDALRDFFGKSHSVHNTTPLQFQKFKCCILGHYLLHLYFCEQSETLQKKVWTINQNIGAVHNTT